LIEEAYMAATRRIALVMAAAVAGTGLVIATPASAAPAPVGASWHLDPGAAAGGPGSLNTAGGKGRLTIVPKRTTALAYSAPVALRDPAGDFKAVVTADIPKGAAVEVDLRGLFRGGWGEWLRLPAELSEPTQTVGVRLILTAASNGAAPVVRDVKVTGSPLSGMQSTRTTTPLTYTVFATREGLVGGTTANGHVITDRDHFVSLSSWRSLSPKGTGDYSVRVCGNGRCAYEPVWDVGPWNTRDDYWNSPREQWNDLPQGRPEAQAAYQNKYNGGKDQFGRTVLNPAGIDLADGTMWDSLGLANAGSAWVSVSYLWTGSGTQGRVSTGGGTLNVRGGATTGSGIAGMAGPYARLTIECRVAGQTITGNAGTTNMWDRIGPGNYVSQAYVAIDSGVSPPPC
jgi:hypothetical protein